MIQADMLDQLREKDPELWEQITGLELAEYEYDDENGSMSGYIYQEDLIEGAQEAWLQHCLQEAIRARGWHISQSVMCWGREQPYYAAIRKSEYEPWAGETGDTEAEALMRAYLSALSGERI